MKKITVFLFLVSSSLFFLSCSKKDKAAGNDLFSYVPADASAVVNLNTGQLRKKIDWDYLNGSPAMALLKLAMKDNMFTKYIFDSDVTGIDFDKQVIAYVLMDTVKEEAKIYAAMPLKDKAKFETTIKDLTKTENFTSDNGYTSCAGPGMIAGWKDDIVLMVMMPGESAEGSFLSADLAAAFAVKKPMPKDDKVFANFMKKNADINVWGDAKLIMQSMPVANKANPFQNTDGIYGITFNKGDITIDYDAYPQDAKGKEMLAKLMNRAPENNMNQYLPDNYSIIFQASAEPNNIIEYAQEITGKDVIEELKNNIDSSLTRDQIAAIISKLDGDMMLTVGNITSEEHEFLLSASTTTDNVIETISAVAKKYTIMKAGDVTMFITEEDTIYAIEKNKLLSIASNPDALQQAMDGKASQQKMDAEASNALQKNPLVFYVDAMQLFESMSGGEKGIITNLVGTMFKDAIIVAEPLQDDKAHGIIKIDLTNTDDYSINVILKTLLESTGSLFN